MQLKQGETEGTLSDMPWPDDVTWTSVIFTDEDGTELATITVDDASNETKDGKFSIEWDSAGIFKIADM